VWFTGALVLLPVVVLYAQLKPINTSARAGFMPNSSHDGRTVDILTAPHPQMKQTPHILNI
jgi:hypothetical protein